MKFSITCVMLLRVSLPLVCMRVFFVAAFMVLKKKTDMVIQLFIILPHRPVPLLTLNIIFFLGVPPYPLFDPVLALGAPAHGRPSLNL